MAAGVSSTQVTINNVVAKPGTGGGRRLLSRHVQHTLIEVHASVKGAERLSDLGKHLGRHSATLHHSHQWEENHAVATKAVLGPF
jgi:hypothetical protein